LNQKTIIIILVVIVVVLLGAVGYLLMTQNTAINNSTNNTTSNNTTISNNNQGSTQVNQTTSSNSNVNSNVNISAAKAKSIASVYLASQPDNSNLAAGTPSLKGGIYYVPMVVTNNEGQHAKGMVVGYVKVDGETGQVFGIQEISMF
jgi:cell division protein YceG involved in septum cleavage